MSTQTQKLLRLMVAIIFTAGMVLIPASSAQAVTYPNPPWWTGFNGANCDYTNYYNATSPHTYPTVLATWNGLKACGPRPIAGGQDVGVQFSYSSTTEYEWECTELVKRYLLMVFGTPSVVANGDEVVDAYANAYPDTFIAVPNDGSTQAFPKIGDVISYSDVHTAIITNVSVTDAVNGDATLSLIEQNASANGTSTQLVDNWVIQGGIDDPNGTGADTITGWLSPVWTIKTVKNPGTYNNLNAVTAVASDDVWSVGSSNGNVGGLNRTYPTIYHWNGSSWGDNANGTNYLDNLLYGVSAISSSHAVAVGGSIYNVAFAMKYNGTSWSSVTADHPGSVSPLMAVSTGTNGNTWAVGYTLSLGAYRPLFEQYNGSSAFTKDGDPFATYSGSSDTRLFGVSVLSSSDAWAVGWYQDGNSQRHPVTLHYDGSSWTYQTTPEPSGSVVNPILLAVKTIASDNVWAVGNFSYSATPGQSEPLVMHWNGSSWTVDTTPAPLLHGTLSAINAASSGTVYAAGLTTSVGTTYPRPLVMRYNGTSWVEISVPTNYGEKFNGIVVAGSSAGSAIWAVGGKSYASTYNLIEQGSVK